MFWRKKLADADYKLILEVLASKEITFVKRRGLKFECQYGDWMVIFDLKNLTRSLLKSKDAVYKRKIIEEFISFKMEALKNRSERKNPAEYLRIALKTIDDIKGMNSRIPDDLKNEVQLITSSIGADIYIISVLDSPDNMEFMTTQHIDRWGISKEQIIGAGFENLGKIAEKAKIERIDNTIVQIVTEERHYEAALILISGLRERFRLECGEEIVFAIPTRDYLFAASSKDKDAVNALRTLSEKIFNNEDYKLTPKILQINEEGELWEFKPGE